MRFVLFALLFALPLVSEAARMSLTPVIQTVNVGDTVTIEIEANTEGQAVMAAEGELVYDPAILEPILLAAGPSLSMWATEPSVSTPGTVVFSGWASAPQTGTLSLARVTFRALQAGEPELTLQSGALLANDGKSSNILSELGRARVAISVPTTGQVLGASTIDAPPPPPQFTVHAERAGDPLVIVGTAEPGSRVVLTLERGGTEESLKTDVPLGAFTIVGERLEAGTYTLSGETYSQDGVLGTRSAPTTFSVVPDTTQVAAAFFASPSYLTILVALASFLFGFFLYYVFTIVRRR